MSGSSHQVGRRGGSRCCPGSRPPPPPSPLSLSVSERSDLFAHTHLRPRPPEAVDVPRSPRFARGRPRVHLSWRSSRARSALPTMTHQPCPVDCAPPLRNLRQRSPSRSRSHKALSSRRFPRSLFFFFLLFFRAEISAKNFSIQNERSTATVETHRSRGGRRIAAQAERTGKESRPLRRVGVRG